MLRPLYYHYKCSKSGRVGRVLHLALRWWLEVLQLEICEAASFVVDRREPVQIFCDARGVPPRLVAVAIVDQDILYTDMEPSTDVMKLFEQRQDNQIMGLETLAIALALSSFKSSLYGRNVRIWSDNVGSESATRKGAAKSFDHNSLIHGIWSQALRLKIALQVDRVPTQFNVADLPSREEYALLEQIGAVWVPPLLAHEFLNPGCWESLSIKQPWASAQLST